MPDPRQKELKDLNYKVRGISYTVHLDIMDNQGRLSDQYNSQPQMIFEANFFPGLKTFLRSLGFDKGFAPTEPPPPPPPEEIPQED